MKRIFGTLCCLISIGIFCTNLYAQNIGGNTCATAVDVGVNNCNNENQGYIPGLAGPSATTVIGPFCGGGNVRTETWLKFTTLNQPGPISTTIALNSNFPTSQSYTKSDYAFEIYTGACASLSLVACVDGGLTTPEEIYTGSLNANTTYYIRLVSIATSTVSVDGVHIFNVCVQEIPASDEIGFAIPLPVNTGTCNYQNVPLHLASASTCAPNPTCGLFTPGTSEDLWYSVVVPPSGDFFISTQPAIIDFLSSTYQPSAADNVALAVYSSSVCGSATLLGCSDSNVEGLIDPITGLPYDNTYSPYYGVAYPSLYVSGATPSSTVYIRVWNEDGGTPGLLNICVNDMGPCGNLPNNDFCSNPAPILFDGATGTSQATNDITGINYTYDEPGDINPSTDNGSCWMVYPSLNSWYSFVATSNDENNGLTINFEADLSCFDVSAAIYDITHSPYGCCMNFTQLDNCDGSLSITNPFALTVAPNVLVAGNTYYLMINNEEPSTCTFTITGWSKAGILPINFISFIGENQGSENIVKWQVANDANVKSYTLESSTDARNFSIVGELPVKKYKENKNTEYLMVDKNPRLDLTYYRVQLNMANGDKKYSNIINVYLVDKYETISNIHPNPTTAAINFEYYLKNAGNLQVTLVDYAGKTAFENTYQLTEGKNKLSLPMSTLENGVYILKVVAEKSGKTTYNKVVKN